MTHDDASRQHHLLAFLINAAHVSHAFKVTPCLLFAVVFLCGCAASPIPDGQREFAQARVDEILSQEPPNPTEYGETKRCLSDTEYRGLRILDDRHILFEGRRGKYWINTLAYRCPDLRFGDTLIMRRFSGMRMCATDRFNVADWFNWPWYRRWPWDWWSTWNTGTTCVLGQFQPVTEDQVTEIRAVLEHR